MSYQGEKPNGEFIGPASFTLSLLELCYLVPFYRFGLSGIGLAYPESFFTLSVWFKQVSGF
jgi:hypothetical protein